MSFVEWDGPLPAESSLGAVHFIAVGGIGMSGIARLLSARGLNVSGCDAKDSPMLTALAALGISTYVGHDPAHLDGVGSVVVSSAIRADNAEMVEARRLGLPVLPRAVALAVAMTGRRGIAVAGTHGKTTTTSMLTVALQACGIDPSYAIGGDLNEPGSNAHAGTGEFFVAEADESDRSFLLLQPEFGLVTNVEPDHLDNYGTADAYYSAFEEFLRRIPPHGAVAIGTDDPGAARLAQLARVAGRQVISFGQQTEDVRISQLKLTGLGSTFELVVGGQLLGLVTLAVPGAYNAQNAAGALAIGLRLGCSFADMVRGLAEFRGARRRFEPRGSVAAIRVFDDYSHHPTEVAAVLGAARLAAGDGRLIVVFQPHLFSRTRDFAGQFADALGAGDVVIVMDVYAAREDPIPGVTGALIADLVALPIDSVHFEPSWLAVPELVASIARQDDLVLTLGAGDVTMLAPAILASLAERQSA